MKKSYDFITGRNKFLDIFSSIAGGLLGIILAVSITEAFFSFDFTVYPQKIVVFLFVLIVIALVLYCGAMQRRYFLLDEKIVYGLKRKEIQYENIHTLLFTLAETPRGLYSVRYNKSYLSYKNAGSKEYISQIRIGSPKNILSKSIQEREWIFSFNCYDKNLLKPLIDNCDADIYVTWSFLFTNQWTINDFSKKYNIPLKKIHLVTDNEEWM